METIEKQFDDIAVGDFAYFEKVVSDSDVAKFAELSGDYNPLHMDETYASNTEFKGRIIHGMYMGALVSRFIGTELPGKRALLLKECLEFKKPARIGETFTISGIVVSKSQSSRILEIKIEIFKTDEIIISGTVHVKVL